MGPCSDLGPVSSLAHGNGIGGKLLKRRGMTSKNSNSSSTAPCFLAALAFAALGLILNFFFLLHLEERSTISSPASGLLRQGKLAVVVPAHRGDLDRALASLSRWPTACSPTLSNVDLILYYAAAPDDKSVRILPSLSSTGGRCFAHTQVVYAYLTDEENVYPKGPSVQFYKMFLEDRVKLHFASYDAVAIIEWDVLVAHERSFEELYHATFHGVEPFWVKGSSLAGTNFHSTAAMSGLWHVLGHINGNAIYNNTDPAFVEFVNFTFHRWNYDYSYDVALWATIADFPYSWPLWQRYSRKFVATNLIANVGFLDVDNRTVLNAVASDTLFIHGSLTGGGGTQHLAKKSSKVKSEISVLKEERNVDDVCKASCGTNVLAIDGASTVCDETCDSTGRYGARFDGLFCGVGDPDTYGTHCRLCYNDLDAARRQELAMINDNRTDANSHAQHVIMCDSLRPPEAADCSPKCAMKLDTICDERCGTGHFVDYNCNWRNRGPTCRYCFNDLEHALIANQAAIRSGGRVIMCDTHEPPLSEIERQQAADETVGGDASDGEDPADNVEDIRDILLPDGREKHKPATPDMEPFTKDLVRGNLCAFVSGYHVFLPETLVAVRSVHHFMPGMRMTVATHPGEFSVFNRTLGSFPGVSIVNTTAGGHASLMADRYCGERTKLIFYMNPGEILSRTFTVKDTHGTNGDLLVPYTEPERVDEANKQRVRATTAVLGFASPSFTYGADLVLPVEVNGQLRELLLSGHAGIVANLETDEVQVATGIISSYEGVFVPEVLAALAYSRNPPGVWFLNPQQWVTHHMFRTASIWDIPLVKPRFGCSASMSLSLEGYDVATELDRLVVSKDGGDCESGFLALEPSQLRPKRSVEFGKILGSKPPPSIAGKRLSVMYIVTAVDSHAFIISLPSVIKNFPDALEVVVVVSTRSEEELFGKIVKELSAEVPPRFPVRVVVAKHPSPTDPRAVLPLLSAGELCDGDFVLHLEPNTILLQPLTYERVFHFGKPVLPFTRFVGYGGAFEECWRGVASEAMGTEISHDFTTHDTHVYPKEMYAYLRSFVRKDDGAWLRKMIAMQSCDESMVAMATGVGTKKFRRAMEYNLMSTLLWAKMPDSMHWRAMDPRDMRPDEWLVDVANFAWSCRLDLPSPMPAEKRTWRRFSNQIQGLHTVQDCHDFSQRWVAGDAGARDLSLDKSASGSQDDDDNDGEAEGGKVKEQGEEEGEDDDEESTQEENNRGLREMMTSTEFPKGGEGFAYLA